MKLGATTHPNKPQTVRVTSGQWLVCFQWLSLSVPPHDIIVSTATEGVWARRRLWSSAVSWENWTSHMYHPNHHTLHTVARETWFQFPKYHSDHSVCQQLDYLLPHKSHVQTIFWNCHSLVFRCEFLKLYFFRTLKSQTKLVKQVPAGSY